MTTPSTQVLASQLAHVRANGLFADLAAAATAESVPLSWVLAIGSRETNLTNILGDHQGGEYHGVGILQGDIQHPEIRQWRDDGTWTNYPQVVIDWCVRLMATNIASVRGYFDDVSDDDVLKIAASGYNCGITRAMHSADNGGDSDEHTTGGDYGADVMRRKAVFDGLLA